MDRRVDKENMLDIHNKILFRQKKRKENLSFVVMDGPGGHYIIYIH
jgi:hypothetical protein